MKLFLIKLLPLSIMVYWGIFICFQNNLLKEEYLNKAIALDKTDLTHQLDLAHVYLFTDRVSEAKRPTQSI